MSGHAIEVRMEDGYVDALLVCLEPPEAACRLTCPNGCEEVAVRVYADSQEPHCDICDTPMGQLEPGDCHIVNWIDDVRSDYAGRARTFRIPVDVDWFEGGATWSLPADPSAGEVNR